MLEITTVVGCRHACVYCPQDKLSKSYAARTDGSMRAMSFETFATCIDKVPRQTSIVFSGMADPMLNAECIDMILYAHESGFRVSLFTTAVGMTPADVDRTRHIPFEHFIVHLPDADEKNTRIACDVKYLETVTALDSAQIDGLDFIVIGRAHPEIQEIVKKTIAERTIIDRAGNLDRDTVKALSSTTIFKAKALREGKIACARTTGPLLNQNVLFPNGDVVLCCMDYNMEHVIGNLVQESYEDMFRSQVYQRVTDGLAEVTTPQILCRSCSEAIRDNSVSRIIRDLRYYSPVSLYRLSPRLHKYMKRIFVHFAR